jgi:hypothetical protein
MAETTTLLAIFEDVEPAAEGVDKLQQLGVRDEDLNVVSGIPIKHTILGRPPAITYVAKIGMVGAILGMLLGLFFVYGVKFLYPLQVGGQPIFPVPQGIIITFEMTMLGLMGFSFIGMFVDSGFPSYTPKQYTPEISDGKIAVLFSIPSDQQEKFVEELKNVGAEKIEPVEARHL